MAIFPWIFGHFGDFILLTLFLWLLPHIWPYLWNSGRPIGLKFLVEADFGHWVLHTKLQPLRSKDAEDIGWCNLRANGAAELRRSVNAQHQNFDELFLEKCKIHTMF